MAKRYSARRVVSADRDYPMVEGDTIEVVRSELEKQRHFKTPDGSAWPGTYRIYDRQPPAGGEELVGEIVVDASGVSEFRRVS
jgi:hypothetical protein